MTDIIKEAERALGRLASDPAAVLGQEFVTGRRHSPSMCPIARYLEAHTHRRWSVWGSVAATDDRPTPGNTVYLPPSVISFVETFDGGGYPELVERVIPNGNK